MREAFYLIIQYISSHRNESSIGNLQ